MTQNKKTSFLSIFLLIATIWLGMTACHYFYKKEIDIDKKEQGIQEKSTSLTIEKETQVTSVENINSKDITTHNVECIALKDKFEYAFLPDGKNDSELLWRKYDKKTHVGGDGTSFFKYTFNVKSLNDTHLFTLEVINIPLFNAAEVKVNNKLVKFGQLALPTLFISKHIKEGKNEIIITSQPNILNLEKPQSEIFLKKSGPIRFKEISLIEECFCPTHNIGWNFLDKVISDHKGNKDVSFVMEITSPSGKTIKAPIKTEIVLPENTINFSMSDSQVPYQYKILLNYKNKISDILEGSFYYKLLNNQFYKTIVTIDSPLSHGEYKNCDIVNNRLNEFTAPSGKVIKVGKTPFNNNWEFAFSEDNDDPLMTDLKWQKIGLPHSFSIPYFRSKTFPIGTGFYRKNHYISDLKNLHYRLDFEGVFQVCEVFVNGIKAGGHEGGYTGFDVDLTPYLVKGYNHIVIKVDNKWRAKLPPRAGEHVFSGGIYRDVYLNVTGPVSIKRNGIKVNTALSDDMKKASSNFNLSYDQPKAVYEKVNESFQIEKINDPNSIVTKEDIQGCTVRNKIKNEFNISNNENGVSLWSPENPVLYKGIINITVNGVPSDKQEFTFAFRKMEFTKDSGFFLNGKHLWLQGANRHQDQAGWGDAVTNKAHYRDAKMIKDCGMNFVRGSHYPHDPAFLDACDELGLIFWSENTFWGIGGFKEDGYWDCSAYPIHERDKKDFEANDKRLLAEMIDDHYNHPCVALWSMGNEPFFTHTSVMNEAKAHIQAMLKYAKELDPSHEVGVGGAQRHGFDKLGGVIGYNGDGATFKKPNGPSVVAEYGSHISDRPGVFDGTWGCTVAEQLPWRSGQALWCAFHHGSIAGSMGRMGMVDYFRLPLLQWYYYAQLYRKIAPPKGILKKVKKGSQIILVASANEIKADGTDDAQIVVNICDETGTIVNDNPNVTLEVISGPGLFPTGKSITFRHRSDIDILEGQAAIALRSYHNGTTVIRATSPDLKSSEIEIKCVGKNTWNDSMSKEYQYTRPYPRIEKHVAVPAQKMLNNIAATRPTRFSSQEDGNRAEHANDGNLQTRWCAKNAQLPAFWTVDLENFYSVSSVEIIFEQAANFSFEIQVSNDEKKWETIANRAQNDKPEKTLKLSFSPTKESYRFLRVYFTKTSKNLYPGIVEILVEGKTK